MILQEIYKAFRKNVFWITLCFTLDGIIILIDTAIQNGYTPPYTIVDYCLWCLQRYSILFIPLLLYVGFKYRNEINSKLLNISSIIIFILAITTMELICFFMFYHVQQTQYTNFISVPNTSNPLNPYLSINFQVIQWGILMISLFVIFIKAKFSIIFSFALSYFFFYLADIVFEIPKTMQYTTDFSSFEMWFPALSTLILLFSSLFIILYKLNIRLNLKDWIILFLSIIPLLFSWFYYYSIWSITDSNIFILKIPIIEPFDRLFAFPLIFVLAFYIYWSNRNV